MGKREAHAIQADPLNVLIERVQAKDDIHSLDEINPDHPVVDMVSVRVMVGVVQPRGGQEADRQVEALHQAHLETPFGQHHPDLFRDDSRQLHSFQVACTFEQQHNQCFQPQYDQDSIFQGILHLSGVNTELHYLEKFGKFYNH